MSFSRAFAGASSFSAAASVWYHRNICRVLGLQRIRATGFRSPRFGIIGTIVGCWVYKRLGLQGLGRLGLGWNNCRVLGLQRIRATRFIGVHGV